MRLRNLVFTFAGLIGFGLTTSAVQADDGGSFGIHIGHGAHPRAYRHGQYDPYRGYRSYSRYRPPYHDGGHYDWHDTSHYDWHPGHFRRHGNHYHYVPGHFDYHRDGHWDYHGPHGHH